MTTLNLIEPMLSTSQQQLQKPDGFSVEGKIDQQLIDCALEDIQGESIYRWADNEGNMTRITINYGWDFVGMECGKFNFKELPTSIIDIRAKLVDIYKNHLSDEITPQYFDNIIVSVYKKGHFLDPHHDVDDSPNQSKKRTFSFAEPILGLILKADETGTFTFYHLDGDGKPNIEDTPVYQVSEQEGTTFLMQGASRHRPYFHGVTPVENERISVTFRGTHLPENLPR